MSRFAPAQDRSTTINQLLKRNFDPPTFTDYYLDSLFPDEISKMSHPHWTPVEVISRVIELLKITKKSKVLDVGSGCGKFCILAALKTEGHFTGVEQRAYLVDAAKNLREELMLKNVTFREGNMMDMSWSKFNCVYLFNPFYENVMPDTSFHIDESITLSDELYSLYVESVEEQLTTLQAGTRVVTYHGFGGLFPSTFERVIKEPILSGHLELWVKRKD